MNQSAWPLWNCCDSTPYGVDDRAGNGRESNVSRGPTPIIRQDGEALDWEHASYDPEVKAARSNATVTHRIQGAHELDAAVARGDAKWAIEVRCPTALYASTTLSEDPQMSASWDDAKINQDRRLFIIPGLLAVRPFHLPTDELTDLWGTEPLAVSVGTWLARGQVHPLEPSHSSLVKFRKDDDLPAGAMRITGPPDRDSLTCTAWLAADIYPRRIEREIWHAALMAAFAMLPTIAEQASEDSGAQTLLDDLADELREKNVAVWTDEDYDAALAASVFEPFQPASLAEEDAE